MRAMLLGLVIHLPPDCFSLILMDICKPALACDTRKRTWVPGLSTRAYIFCSSIVF